MQSFTRSLGNFFGFQDQIGDKIRNHRSGYPLFSILDSGARGIPKVSQTARHLVPVRQDGHLKLRLMGLILCRLHPSLHNESLQCPPATQATLVLTSLPVSNLV